LTDEVPVERMLAWKEGFLRAFRTQFSDTASFIQENRNEKAAADIQERLDATIAAFNATWS